MVNFAWRINLYDIIQVEIIEIESDAEENVVHLVNCGVESREITIEEYLPLVTDEDFEGKHPK